MELSAPPIPVKIPTSMRPAQSVIDHVRNTLRDLVSSAWNKFSTNETDENSESDEKTSVNADNGEAAEKSGQIEPLSTANTARRLSSNTQRKSEAYIERVKTFSLSLWCGKPLCLSPPLLAQYGWECIGEDLMKCCSCSAIVSIRLPWPNASNYHSECIKAQRKIVEGHMKICSWSSNPSNDSHVYPFNVQYLSKKGKEKLKSKFLERATRLYSLNDDLPHINEDVLSDMNLDQSLIAQYLDICGFTSHNADVATRHDKENQVEVAAVLLALCGWDTRNESPAPSIYCNETGRVVGLWNFHSVKSVNGNSAKFTYSPTPAKRSRIEDKGSKLNIEQQYFHPVKQHHIWSPWLVALRPLSPSAAQVDPVLHPTQEDQPPGWTVLRDILNQSGSDAEKKDTSRTSQNASFNDSQITVTSRTPTRTPPRVAVQQARQMFKEWSSPQ